MNVFKGDTLSDKLIKQYQEFGTLYIGVDFDDTIREWESGEPIMEVIKVLKECNKLNLKLCLYTAREAFELTEALTFCMKCGIKIDHVNYSPIKPDVRKPLFNILLDDRAGLKESLTELIKLINYLKNK